jgi:hypothetical protein
VRRKPLYVVGFILHSLLITTVCSRETFSLIAQGVTIAPESLKDLGSKVESFFSAALGSGSRDSNQIQRVVTAYAEAAGIAGSYGFFAPNVPESYELVFELHYPDGSVEYEKPSGQGSASNLRLAGLLDEIGRLNNDSRVILLRVLAYPIWRRHQNAESIRAFFGVLKMPGPEEYQEGRRGSYEFFYEHDFSSSQFAPPPGR